MLKDIPRFGRELVTLRLFKWLAKLSIFILCKCSVLISEFIVVVIVMVILSEQWLMLTAVGTSLYVIMLYYRC